MVIVVFSENKTQQIKEEVTRLSESKKTELDEQTNAAKVTIDEHAGNLELFNRLIGRLSRDIKTKQHIK